MKSQVTLSGHLLFLAFSGWGHLRPLCALAARAIQERPDVAITFLIVGDLRKKLEQEISRYFSDSDVDFGPAGRIRIVVVSDDQNPNIVELLTTLVEAFPGYYDNLINANPVQCAETKTTFDAILKPTAVILDFFLLPILEHIRSTTRKSIPVLAWSAPYVFFILRFLGPEKFGGCGDLSSKARALAEKTGRNSDEILDELYSPQDGTPISVPGMPTLYDYEWSPQETTPDVPHNRLLAAAYIFARECDGIVSVSSTAFEAESINAMRTWLAETNRPLYTIGPLVPPGFGDTAGLSAVAKQMEFKSTKNGGEVQVFLDQILKSHGKHSLIYVSFGSFWWPKNNEHVWVLVDMLLELGFPFILSHASPRAVVPRGCVEKIKRSQIGFLSTWSPQQAILNHPVTGWFLTHCGQNSITESLAQGIPMISWPLEADQVPNAAYLTLTLDVAFEMTEIRTGLGLKPLHRGVQPTGTIEAVRAEARSVLQKARGPEGERKRQNTVLMRDEWKKEWQEGGDALKNLRNMLTHHC